MKLRPFTALNRYLASLLRAGAHDERSHRAEPDHYRVDLHRPNPAPVLTAEASASDAMATRAPASPRAGRLRYRTRSQTIYVEDSPPAMHGGRERNHPIPAEEPLGQAGDKDHRATLSRQGRKKRLPIPVDEDNGPKGKIPVDLNRPNPPAVQTVEASASDAMAAGVQTSLRASRLRAHTQSQPVPAEDLLGQDGDKNRPATAEGRAPFPRQGRKKSLPISVDEDLSERLAEEPNDPKGKKSVELDGSRSRKKPAITQQSSYGANRAAAEPPPKYCSICLEAKYEHECFGLLGCSHVYCSCCVSRYVAAKVGENVVSIGCPDPSCRTGHLEPEMCRHILPKEVFDRWGNALCESMITGSQRFYCPFKDCSALLINEGSDDGEVIAESECPHCFRLFCAKCQVPWHAGVTCEAYQELGPDERGREDLMLMQVARGCGWQRCPKCKFYVERTGGCMSMKCRCGLCFCYGCATEMKMDHYCGKCKR